MVILRTKYKYYQISNLFSYQGLPLILNSLIMFKKSFALLLLLAVFVPLTVFGATIKIGDTYSFKAGEVMRDNLYVGAGEVSIDGNVFGDLVTSGGSVVVSGNISGDATIAGGDISVLEKVNGDLRIIGGDVLVTANVTGDLVVIGGNVKILSGVTVGKDLIVLGGRVLVQGNVNGKVRIIGGEVDIDSKISGDVDVKASESIKIGDSAVILGNLIYSGEDESVIEISDKAVISGEVIFKEGKMVSAGNARFVLFALLGSFLLIKLIAMLVAVVLATIFLKKFSNRVVKDAIDSMGMKVVWGFVALIVIPAAILIFFGSIVGILLGILGTLGYIMLITLATIYSGVIFGAWMDKLIRKKEEITVNWKNGLLGVIVLMFIVQIPLIGGLAGLFFFLLALGSISTLVYSYLWTRR